ncbi:hypothetical protein HPP92_013134 [Vanilla planifolia]|uniref:Uncharacterized protein n=1 Tax=Vanilla planifolia TaxID=51239 RepID=A0A835QRR2_VANPL|nr:hypothetical protein HPP92_013134 [Vanilla planifolia]
MEGMASASAGVRKAAKPDIAAERWAGPVGCSTWTVYTWVWLKKVMEERGREIVEDMEDRKRKRITGIEEFTISDSGQGKDDKSVEWIDIYSWMQDGDRRLVVGIRRRNWRA